MFALFRVLVGTRCFEFGCELFVCGAASASRWACGVYGLGSPRVVGVAAPSDPVGSILVKILHSVEGADVEQVCSNLETNLPCLRSLSLYLLLVFISCMLILSLSLYA